MQDKDVNPNVIRSIWRRTKKGHIKVRDLQPEKDVKGGGGVAGSMIRKLLESPAEPERKAQAERIAKTKQLVLRWLKKGTK
ncbi:MAG: hypothetical protein DMF24_05935 [Verrucomicrobia bacterium]|nr:MAG: hypothetical protein DME90_00455 [Verrucomicrobiota bacterium]PYL61825.1 MAG: hypothetical protein DMF24_05935 [Verrucomicrobiota bacterium]